MASKAKMIMTACFLLSAATMVTTNAAIGRECYDQNKSFADKDDLHKNNTKFLLAMLITGPICICCALLAIIAAIRAP